MSPVPPTTPGPNSSDGPEKPPDVTPRMRKIGRALVVALLALIVLGPLIDEPAAPAMPYSEFTAEVDAGTVKSVTIDETGAVSGTGTDGERFSSRIPTVLDPAALTASLRDKGVEIEASRSGHLLWEVLLSWLPFVLLIGFFAWSARRAQGALSGLGGFGRAKAKIIEAQRPTTRFDDVAGYEGVKEEIGDVVDFLRNPDRYAAAGAKGPRGVVMVGPPGTGKTLLARAVAGQAEVPFLSVTGSAFVEMYVGVGAARVRDLFAEARRRAPSIVFIDEIDAIGGRRGGLTTGGNDEREQTLNQLLAEMDGFDQSSGIVVLAATNRPETLDPALLRPGRFDRQVVVPLPNQTERAAILAVHARSRHLGPDVDLAVVARATPGFSGADLSNLVNEAAINAVRDGRTTVTAHDLDTARDRVLLGRRESSNALLPEERRAVAVHESGHALVAALCPRADPVAKVTILPAGQALGVTEQLPEAERRLYGEGYLADLLAVRLGGRAAELVVLGEGSTGAADDLAGATAIARRMVTEFGLSPRLGPVGFATRDGQYLGGDVAGNRPYSEQTQRDVDTEVARLLREAEARAVDLLQSHRPALERLAGLLLEHETLDGTEVTRVLAGTPPPGTAPRAAEDASPSLRVGRHDAASASPGSSTPAGAPSERMSSHVG